MSQKSYTHNDITTLSEKDHIRQNAGMYIGMTTNPNHLLYEVLDNSLDEANGKHASLVFVGIDNRTSVVTIADNGRGIPFEGNTIPTIATKLFSGGKFNKSGEGSSYGTAIGLHGIGLVAVCALSDWMEIVVYRDGKEASYRFEDCAVVKESIIDFDMTKKPCSTCVKFKPSSKYFESSKFDIAPVRTRLELASIHIDNLKLIFAVDDKPKESIKLDLKTYFNQTFFKGSDQTNCTPIYQVSKKIKDEEVSMIFGWDMNSYGQPISKGSVNLLPVDNGTHITTAYNAFQSVFDSIIKKDKLSFLPGDFKQGMRIYTSIELYKPKYDSQTKERLANSKKELEHLFDGLEDDIEKAIRSDESVFNKMMYYFDNYRRSLSTKKSITKSGTTVSRFNQNIESKLKDCSSTDVSKCELFLAEGDSAAGGLIPCRDPRYHAILGLRGKIPNLAAGNKDFLKNKEITEILNSLGTGIGNEFEIEKLRYNLVCIASDGDADGGHIAALLVIMLLKVVPQLFQHHKVYRMIMPLWGSKLNNKFIPFYEEADMKEFKINHPKIKITRFKGLGEMNPDQLKECMINPDVRRLELIKECTNEEEIFKLMTDAESKRELIGI